MLERSVVLNPANSEISQVQTNLEYRSALAHRDHATQLLDAYLAELRENESVGLWAYNDLEELIGAQENRYTTTTGILKEGQLNETDKGVYLQRQYDLLEPEQQATAAIVRRIRSRGSLVDPKVLEAISQWPAPTYVGNYQEGRWLNGQKSILEQTAAQIDSVADQLPPPPPISAEEGQAYSRALVDLYAIQDYRLKAELRAELAADPHDLVRLAVPSFESK